MTIVFNPNFGPHLGDRQFARRTMCVLVKYCSGNELGFEHLLNKMRFEQSGRGKDPLHDPFPTFSTGVPWTTGPGCSFLG